MGESKIEWTDRTWEPVLGCTRVSPGCENCYAERLTWRMAHHPIIGRRYDGLTKLSPHGEPRWTGEVRVDEEALAAPLRWRRPQRIFTCSRADLFHERVPDEFLDQVFGVMAACRYHGNAAGDSWTWHTFQILTKRSDRARAYLAVDRRESWARWAAHYGGGINPDGIYDQTASGPRALPHVWLGTTVEGNAQRSRLDDLSVTPAAVRFVSLEPMLKGIDLWPWLHFGGAGPCLDASGYEMSRGSKPRSLIDWVIVGGESGPGARPCDVAWIRDVVRQCKDAHVPVLVKQLGANPVVRNDDDGDSWPGCSLPLAEDYEPAYQGDDAPLRLRDRKGGDPEEWPDDLRVREFPEVRHA